jgi:hypothetical protein
MADECSWCGEGVEPGEGYRVGEHPGERRAAFCRLEHVVPWSIQGAHWQAGDIVEPAGLEDALDRCAQCGAELGEVRVVIVRHRGEHRVPDAFCSVGHLTDWAKAGGRYASG